MSLHVENAIGWNPKRSFTPEWLQRHHFSKGVWIASAPSLADPSCLSCIELEKVHLSKEFGREGRPPSPLVVDGEEEYEVGAIPRHKGKGALLLYVVMWKGYPIIEAT